MVKKLLKFFAYPLFFILALMYFIPKTNIYYFLEQKLKPYGVVISSEEIKEGMLTLEIDNADVSLKAIDSAHIAEIKVGIFALYNSVTLNDITLSSAAESLVPLSIAHAKVGYAIWNPLHVTAHAQGDFGEADVKFNLINMSLHLHLTPSDIMLKNYKNTLQNLSKNEQGEYVYDKNL